MSTEAAASSGGSRVRGVLAGLLPVLILTAVAFGVRAYHFNEESVCLEEYVGFKYLDAPDLMTYLYKTRDLYRTMAPLYYAVEYGWTRVFGPSVASVRVISVLSGTLVIPLLYGFAFRFFGRGRFGRRAAFVAGMCAALSPMHVFHSQEARQYAFFLLTGMLSAYTLLRATREGRFYWWVLNIAANFAVAFTHPFGIFLPFAEGLFILLFIATKRRWWGPAFWIACHAALVGCWLLWLRGMPQDPGFVFGVFVPQLSPHRVIYDIVGDDVAGMTSEFQWSGKTWDFLPETWAGLIGTLRPALAKAMLLVLCASMAWSLWSLFRKRAVTSEGESGASFADNMLLWFWLLAPVVVLALVSLRTPCHMPRYTVYSALALYVMVGGAAAALSRRVLYAGAAVVVGIVFLYHLSLAIPGLNGADWRAMAKLVQSTGNPNDVVLVHGTDYLNILLFHMQNSEHPAASTSSREGLCDEADFILGQCAGANNELDRGRAVWAFIILDNGPPGDFESYINARHLKYEKTEFSGLRHFIVYRITRPTATPGAPPAFPPMVELAKSLVGKKAHKEMMRFAHQISWDLDSWGGHYLRLAMVCADRETGTPLAASLFAKSLEFHPQYVSELVNLQKTMLGMELQFDDAVLPALRKALAVPESECKVWDKQAYCYAWRVKAEACIKQGKYDEAAPAIEKALSYFDKDASVATISIHGYIWGLSAQMHIEQGHFAEASAAIDKALSYLDMDTSNANDSVRGYIWGLRAQISIEQENYDAAATVIEKALSYFDSNTSGANDSVRGYMWGLRAQTYMGKADYEHAVTALQKAIPLKPYAAYLRAFLGLALTGKGDDSAARKVFEEFMEMDRVHGAVWAPFITGLFDKKYDDAWAQVPKMAAAGMEVPPLLLNKLKRESGRTQ